MKNTFFANHNFGQIGNKSIRLVRWPFYMRLISWVLIVSFLNLLGGCRYYFKVTSVSGPVVESIDNFENQQKTIILHLENKAWILENVDISENTLTGTNVKDFVPSYHNPIKPKGANRYIKSKIYNQSYILNEAHIYVSELNQLPNRKFSIPLTSISKIEIHEKDKAATIGSWTLGILGVTAATYFVLLIIILLTKSSCPFIYIYDGENYQLAGEIYSGSIQPQLERHDFLKLPDYDFKNNNYQLKIANEVKEIQHTNLMELWVFDHTANMNIWIDKYGNYHTTEQLAPLISAKNLTGMEVTKMVKDRDSLFYSSSQLTGEIPLTDGLIMEFPNPETSEFAKLVVRAKNTFLLDYMMGQFQNQFGDLYGKWNKKQSKAPAEKLRQWTLDQNIPLSVAVERNGEWENVDYFNIAGPMVFKEDILSIPIKGIDSNPLRIKLEFGNFFWDIDFAGIDYSTNSKINYQVIPVATATNQQGVNVKKHIAADDRKYYIQPEVGDNAIVTFEIPDKTLDSRSIFLHSKGWYQILRDPSGTPDREYLETFRQPGRFNQFVNDYIQSITENKKSQN